MLVIILQHISVSNQQACTLKFYNAMYQLYLNKVEKIKKITGLSSKDTQPVSDRFRI